jgi:hypothetical protein
MEGRDGALDALRAAGRSGRFSADGFRNFLDPNEWAKPMPGSFDFGFQRVIEGPTFATLWDFDRRLMKLQQLGQQRTRDAATYHNVILGAWQQAAQRFARRMSAPGTTPPATFREWLDAWIETANQTLVEVHRTPAFLEAQRNVTRSATDYRLAEREVAEAWCELQHLPTRTEIDEMQKTIYELKRELRALTRRANGNEKSATRQSSPASQSSQSSPRSPAPKRKPSRSRPTDGEAGQ